MNTEHRKSAPVRQTSERTKEGDRVDAEDQVIGGGFSSIEEIHDAMPAFLKPDQLADKHGRGPDHPDYDETTLYIP